MNAFNVRLATLAVALPVLLAGAALSVGNAAAGELSTPRSSVERGGRAAAVPGKVTPDLDDELPPGEPPNLSGFIGFVCHLRADPTGAWVKALIKDQPHCNVGAQSLGYLTLCLHEDAHDYCPREASNLELLYSERALERAHDSLESALRERRKMYVLGFPLEYADNGSLLTGYTFELTYDVP